ncbi:MAG: DsbA family protein [Bdellovibrionales bacterium]|nr:DsbA family protein [Bdellovibrionales bacterium]
MKTRVQIALLSTLVSLGFHIYLTLHYYPLKFGFSSGQSICNVNATFNCDAVSASAYASLFGIPLSLWGAALNAVMFFLILLGWLEWTDHPERVRRSALLLSGSSMLASIVMGAISLLLLRNYCLFCIGLYILSIVTFVAYKGVVREPFWSSLKNDIPAWWSESRVILISFAAIPAMAFVGHKMFMQNLGDAELTRLVTESVREWEAAPKQEFVAKPSLVMGPESGKAVMTLVEFADFRCGHCKHASYTLDAFVKAHPDVRFEYYSFPLDGACNEKIESNSGISCRLAQSVYCAEKEGKGWPMHHALFEAQDEVNRMGSVQEVDVLLSKQVSNLGMNWESVERCLSDAATIDAIKAQAKQGVLVNVMGTPTIFANGRQLARGQLIPVLSKARELSVEKR